MAFASGSTVALADYKGANPTGVPKELAQADLIKRGEYLAHAADCIACHTAPGGQPYAGGFAFNLPVIGTIYSTNITPDKETGIGNYTDQQFLDAMHKGIRRDGAAALSGHVLYVLYLHDRRRRAGDQGLSFHPARRCMRPPSENKLAWPFNQRGLMAVWNVFYNADERFRPNPAQSAEWNRGAYLAEAMGHCGECHTPRNLAFAIEQPAQIRRRPHRGLARL